jgi:hypothetical protein
MTLVLVGRTVPCSCWAGRCLEALDRRSEQVDAGSATRGEGGRVEPTRRGMVGGGGSSRSGDESAQAEGGSTRGGGVWIAGSTTDRRGMVAS